MQTQQKTWFITGASKGFGYEITKAALEAGDKVVATVRNNTSALHSDLKNQSNLLIVNMDVTREPEVKDAVEKAIAHFGKLDIVVNNAGYGIVGAIEEVSDAEARKQYDTNVFGVLNVLRATLPYLRKQRSGHIINVSSLFAFDPLIGWALYGSTKNAVEGISQGLAKELEPFGIAVTVIEPGLFRTGFTGKDSFAIAQNTISDYENTRVGQMRKSTGAFHGTQPGDPSKLATLVVKLAHAENPPLHLPIGTDSVNNYNTFKERLANDVNTWMTDSLSTDYKPG
ncbi:SDR family NAD(P)-dependent oxidoreductase [Danxiaibacter flavus]|uniref:SDR family NAD(P)-dependent oxidoreductase n=1 Tax=Danxiaibacter flavus TaxID=3049108 RepID=A0ABV3ZN44_9BACT|nr:SDR family NAD(P)-dependent oxidoreductase [Chitinophagaceae bacterium DXS]